MVNLRSLVSFPHSALGRRGGAGLRCGREWGWLGVEKGDGRYGRRRGARRDFCTATVRWRCCRDAVDCAAEAPKRCWLGARRLRFEGPSRSFSAWHTSRASCTYADYLGPVSLQVKDRSNSRNTLLPVDPLLPVATALNVRSRARS